MNTGVGSGRSFNLVETAHNAMLVFSFCFILSPTYSNRTPSGSPISNPRILVGLRIKFGLDSYCICFRNLHIIFKSDSYLVLESYSIWWKSWVSSLFRVLFDIVLVGLHIKFIQFLFSKFSIVLVTVFQWSFPSCI
jgi:hypothetical protein